MSSRIYVWETEVDGIQGFDFYKCENTEKRSESHRNANKEPLVQFCLPVNHYWDSKEPKLLACELHPTHGDPNQKKTVYGKSEVGIVSSDDKASKRVILSFIIL